MSKNSKNVGRVSTRQTTPAHGDVGLREEAALVPGRGNPTYGANLINGDIPEHWEFTTLGEVCRRGGGNIQTGPFGSQLHASDYVPVGVPSIMPTNIGENRIIEDGIVRITEADANRLGQYRLRAGDIVYSRRGDVEKRALVRGREEGWFCGTGCLKVRLGSGVVDPLFASLYLGHPSVREWIVRHAVGATMPNLNTSIMSAVPFALPPLPEQKAIAHILGTLDDKIELNRRMNATLEAMARALFQSWFVDFDPVRAKLDGRKPSGLDAATAALFPAHFQESPLGHIPQGWEVKTIEELAERVAMGPFGSDIKVSTFVPEGIPVVSGQHLRGTLLDDSEFNFVTEDHADRLKRSNVQRGDVIFTHAGSIGQVAYIPETSRYERYIVSQRQFYMLCNRAVMSPLYITSYFKTPEGQHRLLANTSSTGVPSISQPVTYLRQLKILVPPPALLKVFDATAGLIHQKMARNDYESRTLATLRNALLPNLISGELRVKVATKLAEAIA